MKSVSLGVLCAGIFTLLSSTAALSDPQHRRAVHRDHAGLDLTQTPPLHKRSTRVKQSARSTPESSGQWTLQQQGTTGVAAMQISVVGDHHVIIIDKVENNPLHINGHPAWGVLYDVNTQHAMPLSMITNSFCAGGTSLSNGTFINIGGTAVEPQQHIATQSGLQGIRFFEPSCLSNPSNCKISEWPGQVRLAHTRWYPSTVRIEDGSALILGGSINASFINSEKINVPSLEYYPPKTFSFSASPGAPIPMDFLKQTLNANLFPFLIALPTSGQVLIVANTRAIIYNWKKNTVKKLPSIPNGVRVTYPMTGSGTLLPLSPANGYLPTVLICGGTTIDDKLSSHKMDSQTPASPQCATLVLSSAGIKQGWKVEHMPTARIMPDLVLLPTGKVLIVNGGQSGVAGYGNGKHQVGASNADHPAFQPVMYDPTAPLGSRMSTAGLPATTIARLYHSVAIMTPEGKVMVAGSNPNGVVSTVKYATEYRVEYYSPPWIGGARPVITSAPSIIGFGKMATIQVSGVSTDASVSVNIMDFGFVTHSVHMNSRLVQLSFKVLSSSQIQITAPPNGAVYPPGTAWLHVVVNGIPSVGVKVTIGTGQSPPVDLAAIRAVQGMPGP